MTSMPGGHSEYWQAFASYPEWNQFVDVIQIKLLNGMGHSLHFKHISRAHLALNHRTKVLCKLAAVNGCRHKDDLWGGNEKEDLKGRQ